jgi:hypothetical protein
MKGIKFKPLFFLALALALATGSGSPEPAFAAGRPPLRYDYADMFELTRGVMTRKPARDLLNSLFADQLKVNSELAAKYGFVGTKVKGFTETQMMLLLQEVPSIRDEIRAYLKAVPANADTATQTPALKALREKWKEKFTALFQDQNSKLIEKFIKKNNPLEPFVMELGPGQRGFGKLSTYITHPIQLNGVTRPADNVEQAVVDFIKSAKSQIRFNVFDFDLDSIADALIEAHKSGKDVMGGIDAGVIKVRPEVKAIYDKLVAAGIPIQAVDSVGLNHQKLITIDWSMEGHGRVLMSEGNFTKSCISPGGDLAGTAFHSADAVPNANMVNIVDSDTLSLVVHHELTKTIDPAFALKGKEYPISGAYQILGEAGPNRKARWMIIAFTPNGGLEDINQNFIGRVIKVTKGPRYLAQFAFASKEVEQSLLEDAIQCKKEGREFVMHAVGDAPFAMQKWSVFLSIAGYDLQGEGKNKSYVKLADKDNKWLQALGKDDYAKLVEHLKIAPLVYGNHSIPTADGAFKVTAKLHHKLMVSGTPGNQVGVFGSFNFSEGAEDNQEYIVGIVDDEVNAKMQAIVETLSDQSPRSIAAETERRNKFKEFDPDQGPAVEAPKAGRSAKNVKVNCREVMSRPTVGLTGK